MALAEDEADDDDADALTGPGAPGPLAGCKRADAAVLVASNLLLSPAFITGEPLGKPGRAARDGPEANGFEGNVFPANAKPPLPVAPTGAPNIGLERRGGRRGTDEEGPAPKSALAESRGGEPKREGRKAGGGCEEEEEAEADAF